MYALFYAHKSTFVLKIIKNFKISIINMKVIDRYVLKSFEFEPKSL